MAVFLVALHGLQRAEAAEFAFNRDANLVRQLGDLFGHVDVVLIAGDGFAVAFERAVHHDGRKAQVNGALANTDVLAMVLMHDQRNIRVHLNRGLDQMLDEGFTGVFASAGAGLQNYGRAGFFGGLHHGLHLFEVVDVEGRNAVAVDCCMVQQLTH